MRTTTRSRLITLVVGLPAAAALLAGCGSPPSPGPGTPLTAPSSTTAPSPTPAPTSPTTLPAGTTGAAGSATPNAGASGSGTSGGGATTPSSAGLPRCTTGELTASVGPAEGTAGSTYRDLVLTSRAAAACELTGFPGVSYVTGDSGTQVGKPAEMSGARGGQVRLDPGGQALARLRLVDVGVFHPSECRPTPVRGLRIYPPGDTASLFAPLETTGCDGAPPEPQLEIETVRQG